MKKSFKFRIYPNKEQECLLNRTLSLCRDLYNSAIEQRRFAWQHRRQNLFFYDQTKELPILKKELKSYSIINAQVLQEVLLRVDYAYKNFFRRIKEGDEKPGYPRYRGEDRYDSITYPQIGVSLKIENNKVYLSKLGWIRIKIHRDMEGNPKTATIKRDGNSWYIMFACDNVPEKILPDPIQEEVGIDFGVESICTLSNGIKFENIRSFKNAEEHLAKIQRIWRKKRIGSQTRRRHKEMINKIHMKARNKRRDYLHKLSRRIINENKTIYSEDLKTKEMSNSNYTSLNKAIEDVSIGILIQYLSYKAAEAGKTRLLIKVPPYDTTRTCSKCGEKQPRLKLDQRIFNCKCGFSEDRDINAAKNILRLGRSLAESQKLDNPSVVTS